MAITRVNGGMFGIKLVGDVTPDLPFIERRGKSTLMNFPDSDDGRRIAATIPLGHKSLVYLMAPIRRIWAVVEYIMINRTLTDVIEDGYRAAVAQGAVRFMETYNAYFSRVWRCVRLVAEVDDPARNSPEVPYRFHQGDIMFDMDEHEYLERFNEIPWTWRDESAFA